MPQAQAEQLESIINNRVMSRFGPAQTMDGQTFKQVESELTALSAPYWSSQDAAQKQLGGALQEVNEILRDTLERGNPGKAEELAKARLAYRMLSRVEDASMRRATPDGVFTPADLLQALKSDARRTGNRKAFARGDALLQEYAEAAQSVLPSKVPDSGTPERQMWNRLLTGGGLWGGAAYAGHPNAGAAALGGSALGFGIGSAAYTNPALQAANRMFQPAGPVRNALADLASAPVGLRRQRQVQKLRTSVTVSSHPTSRSETTCPRKLVRSRRAPRRCG